MSKTYRSRLSALNDRVAIQTAVAQLRELARTDTTPALRAARVRDISKNAPSLQGLSHAGVARSRRRRMISAVKPDEPASNFQQRDNATPSAKPLNPVSTKSQEGHSRILGERGLNLSICAKLLPTQGLPPILPQLAY
jgi:hypothetical protein